MRLATSYARPVTAQELDLHLDAFQPANSMISIMETNVGTTSVNEFRTASSGNLGAFMVLPRTTVPVVMQGFFEPLPPHAGPQPQQLLGVGKCALHLVLSERG